VINILIQSFVNLFRYLLAMKPRIGGFEQVVVPPGGYEYIAVQKIRGDFDMRLFLCFRREMICLISSALLKREMKEIDELTLDSAKEFINIVTGYTCSSLSLENLKVDPGIPEILTADKVEAGGGSLKVPFLLPKGIVEMRLFFES
jgi:CheY-specific phosphatase CheX